MDEKPDMCINCDSFITEMCRPCFNCGVVDCINN